MTCSYVLYDIGRFKSINHLLLRRRKEVNILRTQGRATVTMIPSAVFKKLDFAMATYIFWDNIMFWC